MIPLRVTSGRVLIRPDVELQAVEQQGGLYIAKTLDAAVSGEDPRDAWYSGTVIDLPDDRSLDFDVRPFLRRRLRDLLDDATYDQLQRDIGSLIRDLDELPMTRERGFRVGDRVTFGAHAGEELTVNGETYLILAESDVLGVLECA